MKPEKKRKMMETMMPKMMEGMEAEDMMTMMSQMMPKMMKGCMESMSSGDMMEAMHEMMPKMMENCLTSMNKEERQKNVYLLSCNARGNGREISQEIRRERRSIGQ